MVNNILGTEDIVEINSQSLWHHVAYIYGEEDNNN
jgi:hypothetical protein